jgi:hypothetical protein
LKITQKDSNPTMKRKSTQKVKQLNEPTKKPSARITAVEEVVVENVQETTDSKLKEDDESDQKQEAAKAMTIKDPSEIAAPKVLSNNTKSPASGKSSKPTKSPKNIKTPSTKRDKSPSNAADGSFKDKKKPKERAPKGDKENTDGRNSGALTKKGAGANANLRMEKIEKYLHDRFDWLGVKAAERLAKKEKDQHLNTSSSPAKHLPVLMNQKKKPRKYNYVVDMSEKP